MRITTFIYLIITIYRLDLLKPFNTLNFFIFEHLSFLLNNRVVFFPERSSFLLNDQVVLFPNVRVSSQMFEIV